nr:thrombospondin type 3 repeat-containing protein [Gammaproteobacteria bacterium]
MIASIKPREIGDTKFLCCQWSDTEQFDDDNDGVSNLSESIAGTNPLIIETGQLEILETYYETSGLLAHVGQYEAKLVELPYFEQSEKTTSRPWIGEDADYVSSIISIE